MAKDKKIYICDDCGNELLRWQGQCPACNSWNTIKEIKGLSSSKSGKSQEKKFIKPQPISKVDYNQKSRIKTGISEFDRVLGGGFVEGSLVLIGGQPGIGKSTLLLQAADQLKNNVLYFSSEESQQQIKLRSDRLGLGSGSIDLISSQDITDLINVASDYKIVIVDSIQTVMDPSLSSNVGGVAQIKSATYRLQELAKKNNQLIVITGHITKQGQIAGPKTLEHLVDTVLYIEGDKYQNQRIVRATKNRFGSTGEAGIFKMTREGLQEITDPSDSLIGQRKEIAGSAVTSIIEGQRPLLVEFQALSEKTVFGYPKRRSEGFSLNRLEVLTAVIDKHTDINLSDKDIYANIIGGINTKEPAIDLSVCLAIISSVKEQALKKNIISFGEVSLSGEIREVIDLESRLREASRFGFNQAIVPMKKGLKFKSKNMNICDVSTLKQALRIAFK